MSKIRFPQYYKKFRCTQSACTDNCCIGWEIDIDEETLDFYKSVMNSGSPLGERMRQHIVLTPEANNLSDSNDQNTSVLYDTINFQPHFKMGKDGRCPFLNDCNLCDIILEHGEEHISQICTDHPRFYDWFTDLKEAGIGLVCEEAARLILTNCTSDLIVEEEIVLKEDKDKDNNKDEHSIDNQNLESANSTLDTDECDSEVEDLLFEMRQLLFDKIERTENFNELLSELYKEAMVLQSKYEAQVYPDFPTFEPEDIENFNWVKSFWTEGLINQLFELFLTFPTNFPKWQEYVKELKSHANEIIGKREDFLKAYPETINQYKNLLTYFIFRHFMKARLDDLVFEKVAFALLSVSFIEIMDIYSWMNTGLFTLEEQINLCKAFSREVEYNLWNTEDLSLFLSE